MGFWGTVGDLFGPIGHLIGGALEGGDFGPGGNVSDGGGPTDPAGGFDGGGFDGGGFDGGGFDAIVPAEPIGTVSPYYADPSAMTALALPGAGLLPQTFKQFLKRVLVWYGPQIAEAVIKEFLARRAKGQNAEDAMEQMAVRLPKLKGRRRPHVGRRRINPANVRALRRAVRRIKSFRRITRKVRGVLPSRGRGYYPHYRRRRRRGDLWPRQGDHLYEPEEYADEIDEAEDLGIDPDEFFQEDEM